MKRTRSRSTKDKSWPSIKVNASYENRCLLQSFRRSLKWARTRLLCGSLSIHVLWAALFEVWVAQRLSHLCWLMRYHPQSRQTQVDWLITIYSWLWRHRRWQRHKPVQNTRMIDSKNVLLATWIHFLWQATKNYCCASLIVNSNQLDLQPHTLLISTILSMNTSTRKKSLTTNSLLLCSLFKSSTIVQAQLSATRLSKKRSKTSRSSIKLLYKIRARHRSFFLWTASESKKLPTSCKNFSQLH